MKTPIYVLIILSFCVLSCNSENKKKEIESIESVTKKNENNAPDSNNTSDIYQQETIESVFNKLRSDGKLNKGKEGFIVQEKIEFSGKKFKYFKVMIPKFKLLEMQADASQVSNADLANTSEQQIVVDTTLISGQVNIKNFKKDQNLNILVTGSWKLKASVLGEYDVVFQREFTDAISYDQNIDLTSTKKYTKDDLYLKVRITELKKSDLTSYSKAELSYLRNEIFARYGHIFKTDKMKSYFSKKSWYIPLFIDATELINEIEKKNIQLIKKLESL